MTSRFGFAINQKEGHGFRLMVDKAAISREPSRRFVRPTCWNSPRSVFGHGRPHDGHNALRLEAASAGAAAIDLLAKIS